MGPVGPVHDQTVVVAAAARIDDDPLARQPRAGAPDQLLLADGVQRAAGHPRTQKVQGAQRFWAADAVGVQTVLALVGHQPVVRLQTEVPVDQVGVETEVLQPRLQRRDVVAVHRRAELVGQRARAEAVGRLLERAVGGLTDDAVDEQAAVLLKRAHRLIEVLVEHVERDVLAGGQVRVGAVDQPQRRQRRPNLGDRTSPVTATQTRHTRPFGHVWQRIIRWRLQDTLDSIVADACRKSGNLQARRRPGDPTCAQTTSDEFAQQRGLALGADDPLHRLRRP